MQTNDDEERVLQDIVICCLAVAAVSDAHPRQLLESALLVVICSLIGAVMATEGGGRSKPQGGEEAG